MKMTEHDLTAIELSDTLVIKEALKLGNMLVGVLEGSKDSLVSKAAACALCYDKLICEMGLSSHPQRGLIKVLSLSLLAEILQAEAYEKQQN